jgi:uncharacterized membrane protein SpoIIM required for sporulation
MTEFGHGGFVFGSNALWVYMVVNASLRSYIIHQDQLRIFTPKYTGKRDNHNIIFTST